MTAAKKKVNFTEGPLFWRLIIFALPIMAGGVLQMLYNAADKMVVGNFSGDPNALGAIASTTHISGLLINFMAGLGAGAGVLVAQSFGSGRRDDTSRAVHTSLIMAVGIAAIITAVGYSTAKPLLRLLGTKPEFMDGAFVYLCYIYAGILATSLYNTTAAIFRAVGDSRTPLIIGAISGLMNVLLNLVFVILFKMSVAGVALATVVSQYFSAIAGIFILSRRRSECYAFSFKKLKCDRRFLMRALRIGVPTGLQSVCFAVTNMMTTSAVNTLPKENVTAFSVAGSIDGILDVIAGAFCQSAMNASGQNLGAGKPDRIRRVFFYSLIQSMAIMFVVAWTLRFLRADIAALFVDSNTDGYNAIIDACVEWTGTMLALYFLQGAMNAVLGTVRGLGYSLAPLILNIIGTCITRAIWIFVVFPLEPFHTFGRLALLYPVSWAASALLISIIAVIAFKKLSRIQRELNAKGGATDDEKTSQHA